MWPAVDPVLMITPPDSSMIGSTARHIRNVPVTLMSMMRCQSARSTSWVLANASTPARLTSTSTPPASPTAASTKACTDPGSATSHRAVVMPV